MSLPLRNRNEKFQGYALGIRPLTGFLAHVKKLGLKVRRKMVEYEGQKIVKEIIVWGYPMGTYGQMIGLSSAVYDYQKRRWGNLSDALKASGKCKCKDGVKCSACAYYRS